MTFFVRSKVSASIYQEILEHFTLLFADRNMHRLPKVPMPGLRNTVTLCLFGLETDLHPNAIQHPCDAKHQNAEKLKVAIRAT